MRKIAVINFKGGTGKTTTVINVGAGLAKRNKRVLLIDTDAQGSLGLSLGISYKNSLADVLTRQATIQECVVRARKNLYVIPSDSSLMLAQKALASYVNWQATLGTILQPIEQDYDFILLDCAASITILNINALNYATEVFIPTQVEYLSLAGLNQVLENLARIRYPGHPRKEVIDLGISLIIPTMYDMRTRQSRELLNELRQTYGRHVAHPIRINVRLSEAPSRQQTIFEYAPRSRGAFDYNRLVELVLQETLLAGEKPIGLEKSFRPSRPQPLTPEPESAPEEMLEIPDQPTSQPETAESTVQPAWARESQATQCPYCNIPLSTTDVAGYRVYLCTRCGYQKQVLQRDLRTR